MQLTVLPVIDSLAGETETAILFSSRAISLKIEFPLVETVRIIILILVLIISLQYSCVGCDVSIVG